MGESKEYMTLPEENGSINISEEVIAAIAVGAVRDVEGVSGMVTAMGGSVTDLVHNKKNAQKGAKGVKIDMTGAALVLDIYLTVEYGHPIPTVAENAQKAVIGAVEAMTGCSVEAVNIHVGGMKKMPSPPRLNRLALNIRAMESPEKIRGTAVSTMLPR